MMSELSAFLAHAMSGSMLLAVPLAALVGAISFLSPCVIPLIPGYVAYATGLGAQEVVSGRPPRRRVLIGTLLFVSGFALVFMLTGILVGVVGRTLLQAQSWLAPLAGIISIVVGLSFMGAIPIGRREIKLPYRPRAGLAFAPVLGMVFGFGWAPCIGPTLAAVLTLAFTEASATRGAILALSYALGLGIPFVVAGMAWSRLNRTISWFQRHQRAVLRLGGSLLIVTGLLLATGMWNLLVTRLRQWTSGLGFFL